MKQTKSRPTRRGSARGGTPRSTDTPPAPLDLTSYPSLLREVAAARKLATPERRIQHLNKYFALPRTVAQRCLNDPGFAPYSMRDAKYAYLIDDAVKRACAIARRHTMTKQELRQLPKRISAEEAHRTMIAHKTCPRIPKLRCIQQAFRRLLFHERGIDRKRILLKNTEDTSRTYCETRMKR
jgi:hypothetical protein